MDKNDIQQDQNEKEKATTPERKKCMCGRCAGLEFTPSHPRQKYHPDCALEKSRELRRDWNRRHPEIIRAAIKKHMGTMKWEETQKSPIYHIKRHLNRLLTEGRVHESIALTLMWKGHYAEPLEAHERTLLKPDDNSPIRARTKEIDFYNSRFHLGYDVRGYWSAMNDSVEAYQRNLVRAGQDKERGRLAEKIGVDLIVLPFAEYQVRGDIENQDGLAKVANFISERTTVPMSGMVESMFAHDDIAMGSNFIIPPTDIIMPVFPPHICKHNYPAVCHPNGNVYVLAKGDVDKERDFMLYDYVYLVEDLAPYRCQENVPLLKENPEHFITEHEKLLMRPLKESHRRIFTAGELIAVFYQYLQGPNAFPVAA